MRALKTLAIFAWALLAPFVGAGTFHYGRGWLYVGLWLLVMPATAVFVSRRNPAVNEARTGWWRPDTKLFDKIFLSVAVPLMFLLPILGGYGHLPMNWFAAAGALLYVGGSALNAWVLSTNPFAETSVRIQTDRGQRVVGAGPYRFVRHPMYLGAVGMQAGVALTLGSQIVMLAVALLTALYVARTALEDRTLRRELAGYEEFAARTPYRLVPGIW